MFVRCSVFKNTYIFKVYSCTYLFGVYDRVALYDRKLSNIL